jgi:hypothetical protein
VIDWPLAFSSASQAIKVVNELRAIDKEVSLADLKLKVADLTGSLADIKLTLTQAKSDASEKDEEIARQREDGKEGGAGNPMCDVCLQKNGLLIETANIPGKGIMALQCPNCKAVYGNLHQYTD